MQNPFTGFVNKSKSVLSSLVPNGRRGIFGINFSNYGDDENNSDNGFIESFYNYTASEFSKLDIRVASKVSNEDVAVGEVSGYRVLEDDNLSDILSLRPNALQTASSLQYVVAYQTFKHGQALIHVQRNTDGRIVALDPLNIDDYSFGNGYILENGDIYIRVKDSSGEISLLAYSEFIHIRLNPNDIYSGDVASIISNDNLIKLFNRNITTALKDLSNSGSVRGILKLGTTKSGFSNQQLGDEALKATQTAIIDRIKETGANGILALDAGEEFTEIRGDSKTIAAADVESLVKHMFTMRGVNPKVVAGTATQEEMEVAYSKIIAPFVEQYIQECTYKLLSKRERGQGKFIDFYRNPFEYVSIIDAIDVAYKGAMDTTPNERREFIYKLPPIKGGDLLSQNLNFKVLDENSSKDTDSQSQEVSN